jgi:predicted hydrocarbon binding protein
VQDTGDLLVTIEEPGLALVRLVGFPPGHPELCRLTTGYITETLNVANATSIKVQHQTCRTQGASECRWRATWQA